MKWQATAECLPELVRQPLLATDPRAPVLLLDALGISVPGIFARERERGRERWLLCQAKNHLEDDVVLPI